MHSRTKKIHTNNMTLRDKRQAEFAETCVENSIFAVFD